MRVLHLIEGLGLGGAERLLVTLLPLLAHRGVESEVAVLRPRMDLAADLQEAGIAVHSLDPEARHHPWGTYRRLAALLRARRYELLHTHLAHANLLGRLAALTRGLATTTTYHDTDYEPEVLMESLGTTWWKQRTYQALDAATAKKALRVVAVSQCVADSVANRLRIPPHRVEVIYNGVASAARPSAEERARHRRDLGLEDRDLVAVQVGRLVPQKGPLHALRAASLLRGELPLRLILVGEGPLRPALEREISGQGLGGTVRLAGAHADVRPFLASADIFLFPSLHEGLGIAALEAMAIGLPVVAYRAGALEEVVQDHETGILVPLGQPERLAQALRELALDLPRARAYGERGRLRAEQQFGIGRCADRHASYYAAFAARAQK